MKISLSLPEEVVKAVDRIISQPSSPVRSRSAFVAAAVREFLARNYPEPYLESIRGKIIKPTVLSYLKAMPSERFKTRSPHLRGRRIQTEWVEVE